MRRGKMRTIITIAVLLAATPALAGKGDRPYYCPAGNSAAVTIAMPECGAGEYLRKMFRLGEFANQKQPRRKK
jgi:hypothetical protein